MQKWQRDPIPPAGSGNFCVLLKLAFPSNHLSLAFPEKIGGVTWIPPAAPGRATGLEIFLTLEDETTIRHAFDLQGERRLLYFERTRSGLSACLSALDFDCGPVDLRTSGNLTYPDMGTEARGRPIRMLLIPGAETPLTGWELGGYPAPAALASCG